MLSRALIAAFFIAPVVWAQSQQTLPILRQSASSLTRTHASFEIDHVGGVPYVRLEDVSSALGGQLRWKSTTRAVELTLKRNRIRFVWGSVYAHWDGKRVRLAGVTRKQDDGFWVPMSFFTCQSFFKKTGTRLGTPSTAKTNAAEKKSAKTPKTAEPAERTTAVTRDVAPAQPASHGIRRIVIDPGHGGKDPGTVSPKGVQEKDINLRMSQELADVLRDDFGYEVLLTRTDDSFIPLAERSRIANKANADLFVSLHCNASLSRKLKGFEVYFLSEDSSDPHANAVARTENAPLALEGESSVPPAKLNALLRSLVRNANINESSAMGSLIDKHVAQKLSEPSLGVKQAGFYVLRGAEMPAVLIEAGFLTNPREEKLLQSEKFRARLALGIASAIRAYDLRKQKER